MGGGTYRALVLADSPLCYFPLDLLHKHGIAVDCYRAADADLEVRDACTGQWSRGGRWSSAAAVLGAIQKA